MAGKKILITGVSGFLGSNLAFIFSNLYDDYEVNGVYNSAVLESTLTTFQLDLTELSNYSKMAKDYDVVIHCAALSNIDHCQSNPSKAVMANIISTMNIVSYFNNSKIIYISTDNVYKSSKKPQKEDGYVRPINVYGHTKHLAEQIVISHSPNNVILRTNFIGWDSRTNTNSFLERILQTLRSDLTCNLFEDVTFSPVSINTLSRIIMGIIKSDDRGTFNVSGEPLTKLDFGLSICNVFNVNNNNIKAISIDDLSLLAPRPKHLVLNNHKIVNRYGEIDNLMDELTILKHQLDNGYKVNMDNFIRVIR